MAQEQTLDARRSAAGFAARAGWRVELRAMLSLGLPLAITQLAQIGVQTTDVLMMGWLGPQALAAGGLGFSLYMPLWLLGLGLVLGAAPLMAHALGAGDERGLRRTLRQGLWVALAYSLPAMLVLWHVEPILLLLGQAPDIAALSQDYMRAMVWSFPTSLCFLVLRSFMATLARPLPVLLIVLVGILCNALGNWLLMSGTLGLPPLGVVGIGASTAVTYLIVVVLLLALISWDRRLRHYRVTQRFWRPDWRRFAEITGLGLPIGLGIIAETGLFSASGMIMGRIGTVELAAHQIALQCAAVAFMLPLGLSQATTARIGIAMGAGNPAGVGRAGWTAFVFGACIMALTATAFLTLPETIAGWYLDEGRPDSATVLALAVAYLTIAALFQLFDGTQIIAQGSLRGLKDTRVPMVMAFFSFWGVGAPLCLWLGLGTALGGLGVWIGLACALAVQASLLTLRFRAHERRLARDS